jgi:hypothetical protein
MTSHLSRRQQNNYKRQADRQADRLIFYDKKKMIVIGHEQELLEKEISQFNFQILNMHFFYKQVSGRVLDTSFAQSHLLT